MSLLYLSINSLPPALLSASISLSPSFLFCNACRPDMAKFTTLFLVTLIILCSTLSHAARSVPAFADSLPAKFQHEGVEAEKAGVVEESCEGVAEEECLMRRTLAAHIDYIYTQKHNKP